MFGLAVEKRNETEERRSEYVSRLTAVLSDSDGIGVDCIVDTELSQVDPPPSPERADGDLASPAPEAGTISLAKNSVPFAAPVDGGQDAPTKVNGNRLEEAARQIAEALSSTLYDGVRDIRKHAARDQAKLENTAETLAGLVSEFRQVKTELTGVQEAVESQNRQRSDLDSTFALFDNRLGRGEAELLGAQDRIAGFSATQAENARQFQACAQAVAASEARLIGLDERLNEVDFRLEEQKAAAGGQKSICEQLEQAQTSLDVRLVSQERTIQELKAEVQRRGSLLDGLLRSLRSLEGRRDSRHAYDKPVRVGVAGLEELAIAGRVVNASESGLGLTLEAPASVGSELQVDLGNKVLCGKVVHCSPIENGYTVGLKLAATH